MAAKSVTPAVAVGKSACGHVALIVKDDDREIGRPFVRKSRHGSQIQQHAAVGFDSYDAPMRQYQGQTQTERCAHPHIDLIKVRLFVAYGEPFSCHPSQGCHYEIVVFDERP